ncbi:MAG: NERD domain-containing protein [Lachnospiraceae bacterium]|nr:NERD domain-containing protein [Lachnospiraceae bacterium]
MKIKNIFKSYDDVAAVIGIILGVIFLIFYKFELIPDYSFKRLCLIMIYSSIISRILGKACLFTYVMIISIISFMYPITHYIEKLILLFINIAVCYMIPSTHNHDTEGIKNEVCISGVCLIYFISSVYCAIKIPEHKIYYIIASFILIFLVYYYNERHDGIVRYDEDEAEHLKYVKKVENSSYAKASNKSYDEIISDKGTYGEYVVSTWINDYTGYHKVLYNVFVPYEKRNGVYQKANELDAVVITQMGIYCLEIKNQKTTFIIKNDEDDAICLYPNGNKELKHNPFKQNKGHISALKKYIDENYKEWISLPIYGFVIFGPDTIDRQVTNVKQYYCSYKNIGRALNDLDKRCKNKYSKDKVDVCYGVLKRLQNNKDYKALHSYNIYEKQISDN